MPRSKRSKLVTLAQTDKKGRGNKARLFDEVREALDNFRYLWVLRLDHVRTPVLQDLRSDWVGSKLLLGKRRVLEKALGGSPSEEYKDNLHKISRLCSGVPGLLFTNEEPSTVQAYFAAYAKADYSRAKSRAPIDFTIPEGIIFSRGGQISIEEDVPMSHSLEETLRNKYRIPTKIKSGKIYLNEPFVVCQKGETLSVTQALILKQFGIASSEFRVKINAYYDVETKTINDCKVNL